MYMAPDDSIRPRKPHDMASHSYSHMPAKVNARLTAKIDAATISPVFIGNPVLPAPQALVNFPPVTSALLSSQGTTSGVGRCFCTARNPGVPARGLTLGMPAGLCAPAQ